MRLIFLAEFKKNTGGMMQSLISLVSGLSESKSYDICIVSPCDSEISRLKFNDNVRIITTQCQWVIDKKNIFNTIRTSLSIFKLIKGEISSSYLVSNDVGASFLISLFPTFRKREIYICRGGLFDGFSGKVMKFKIKYKLIYKVITTSFSQLEVLKTKCGYSKDITVIHNGVNTPKYEYEFPDLSKHPLRISTIGYVSRPKGQIKGVKLINLLRNRGIDAILNIYGTVENGDDELYFSELKDAINKLDLVEYVSFCGYQSTEDMYKNTDILISFSEAEGFGRTLVEGMFRLKPVIAYAGAGGPIDITNNGQYGYLSLDNTPESYYRIICNILDDNLKARNIAINAQRFSLKKFNINSMVQQYSNFFKSIDVLCK